MPTTVTESQSHENARRIMGDSMIGLPEVEKLWGESMDDCRRCCLDIKLREIPFSEELLRSCAQTHVLIADIGISIAQMYRRFTNLFHPISPFTLTKERCRTDEGEVGWRLIRKDVLPGSVDAGKYQQEALVKQAGEKIPTAREVVYLIVHFQQVRDQALLRDMTAGTRNFNRRGSYVTVRNIESRGIELGAGYHMAPSDPNSGFHIRGLGIASAYVAKKAQ